MSSHLNGLVDSRTTAESPTAEIDSVGRKSGEKECKCNDADLCCPSSITMVYMAEAE